MRRQGYDRKKNKSHRMVQVAGTLPASDVQTPGACVHSVVRIHGMERGSACFRSLEEYLLSPTPDIDAF